MSPTSLDYRHSGRASLWSIPRPCDAVAVALFGYWGWSLMLVLLFLMWPKHPPTADDSVPLGTARTILGWLTLGFVILGFTPQPFYGLAQRANGRINVVASLAALPGTPRAWCFLVRSRDTGKRPFCRWKFCTRGASRPES